MTVHETLVRDAVDAACRHVLFARGWAACSGRRSRVVLMPDAGVKFLSS